VVTTPWKRRKTETPLLQITNIKWYAA